MTAAMNDVDEETLKSLHVMCVTEVRKINGIIDYEEAEGFITDFTSTQVCDKMLLKKRCCK